MNKTLYIIRGIPGSGKTTLARKIAQDNKKEGVWICEADHYFERNGKYDFNPSELGKAHDYCKSQVRSAMEIGDHVIVSNTSTRKSEYQVYLDMAKEFGYEVKIHDVFDGGKTDEELAARNVHGVPLEVIKRMRARWEKS